MSTSYSRVAPRQNRQTLYRQYAIVITKYITSVIIATVFAYFFFSWLSERSTFRLLGDGGIQMAMVHKADEISFYISVGIVLTVVAYSMLEDCGMLGVMAVGMLVSTIGIWDVLTAFLVEDYCAWPARASGY